MPADQLDTLPEGVSAHAHPPVELRGFPEPVDVVELSACRWSPSATTPASCGPARRSWRDGRARRPGRALGRRVTRP